MGKNAELEKILEMIDENGPVPYEEPVRQYYFIKKCRTLLDRKKYMKSFIKEQKTNEN